LEIARLKIILAKQYDIEYRFCFISYKTAINISYHYPNFTANGTTIITYALTKYCADFEKEEIEIES